jgi:hypothetical protein
LLIGSREKEPRPNDYDPAAQYEIRAELRLIVICKNERKCFELSSTNIRGCFLFRMHKLMTLVYCNASSNMPEPYLSHKWVTGSCRVRVRTHFGQDGTARKKVHRKQVAAAEPFVVVRGPI